MLQRINQWLLSFFSNPNINKLALLGLTVAVLLWLFIDALAPLLFGLLIAYLLEDIVIKMTTGRWRIPRAAAAAIVVFATVCLVIIIVSGLPRFLFELRELGNRLPEIAILLEVVTGSINNYLPEGITLNKDVIAVKIGEAVTELARYLLNNTLGFAGNVFAVLLYAVLLPLFIFFMLKDKEAIVDYGRRMFFTPLPAMCELWKKIDSEFGAYIRGKFIEASIIGIMSWLVFLFFRMDYAFVLATAIGLSVFIPFVGAIVVTFPVVLFAYLQFGWGTDFAFIVILYSVIQIFDGQLLVPLLFSEIVKIHPVSLFIAIVFFGNVWGVWGVFFAIPLAVIIKHVIIFISDQRKTAT